jgi:hypothetical protein
MKNLLNSYAQASFVLKDKIFDYIAGQQDENIEATEK